MQRRSAPKRSNSHGHEADDNSVWDITGIQHHKCNPMGALLWGDLDKISDPDQPKGTQPITEIPGYYFHPQGEVCLRHSAQGFQMTL